MGSVNSVFLIGNLGRDAELKYTPTGAAVAKFSIAMNEVYTDKKGDRQEKTEWVNVVLWGKSAESLAEYLTKGKQVCVQGKITTRSWDDKDGNKKYMTEVNAQRITLLGGGGGNGRGRARDAGEEEDFPQEQPAQVAQSAPLTDDDIPF